MKLSYYATALSLSLLAGQLFAAEEPFTPAAEKTTAVSETAAKTDSVSTADDNLSYALGQHLGNNLKQQMGEKISLETLFKGMQDAYTGAKTRFTSEEAIKLIREFQQTKMSQQMEELKQQGEKNLKAGEQFLEENKKNEGVTVLPSGLQYKVLKEGTGKTPTASDEVTTHYKGTLIDGTVFDSSYERGEPVTFPVNGVIAGWTEALQLMKEGAKWQLVIPAKLAYGENGRPGAIGPQSTLVFEVELLSVKEASAAPAEEAAEKPKEEATEKKD